MGLTLLLLGGCVTPEYAVRQTPVPDESDDALQIEQTISAVQAKDFEKQGARVITPYETLGGFHVTQIVNRLVRVTERPYLPYQPMRYEESDPNAAALADGRLYISTGMLDYLQQRGSREDELAFVLAHELGHTAAQHLVKRYRTLQQRQVLLSLVSAGASALTLDAGAAAQEMGRLATNVASMLNDVSISGYSQDQELEADQLGMRYLIRAGFDPYVALAMLKDFARFENPMPFLRTHPYTTRRVEDLYRYLAENYPQVTPGHPLQQPAPLPAPSVTAGQPPEAPRGTPTDARRAQIERLRAIQRLYPRDSLSWKNLEEQIRQLQLTQ